MIKSQPDRRLVESLYDQCKDVLLTICGKHVEPEGVWCGLSVHSKGKGGKRGPGKYLIWESGGSSILW